MKKILAIIGLTVSPLAAADIFWAFREADGSTNWQYIANFSSGILILALSYTVIRLFLSRRQANRYNRELEDIRSQLEQRVIERTATLNESNNLLKESNVALAEEIDQHLLTTNQLRQSESYINEILQSMPLILIGLDRDNNITQWNPQAEQISGLTAAKVITKNLWDCYPDITVTPEQIAEAADKQQAVNINYSQYGQYHFDITIYPLKDQQVTGVVLLLDDVTQRVNSETMLIQKDKMSLVGEMASSMAHDVKLPLASMLSTVKTVRQDLADNIVDVVDLRDTLEDVLIHGQQAKAVVENLLGFSSSGGEAKSLASIKDIVEHSIDLAENVLASSTTGLRLNDIAITLNYGDDLPDFPCYPTELQQVFLSLIRQACTALGNVDDIDHKPEIRLSVSRIYEDLWVSFAHNGQPMGEQDQIHLFDSFTPQEANVNNNRNQRLSFTHFIITEQHRGQVALSTDDEGNTIFSLQLPLA